MWMNAADYRARTRAFAIAVVRQVRRLPPTLVCRTIGAQLSQPIDRRVCAKLGNVLEESDESAFWLDLLVESGEHVPVEQLRALQAEAEEIVAMTVASIRTAARSLPSSHPARRQQHVTTDYNP
jgi:hypothetical protein